MKAFEFDLQIKADSQEEALRKANAVVSIMEVLSVEEVEKLAQLARDPKKLQAARRFLNV
jgi:hypothetical protein